MKFFLVILAVLSIFSPNRVMGLKNAMCGLPRALDGVGLITCEAYFPSWTYNLNTNACEQFIYGGCGGNANRFISQKACVESCVE